MVFFMFFNKLKKYHSNKIKCKIYIRCHTNVHNVFCCKKNLEGLSTLLLTRKYFENQTVSQPLFHTLLTQSWTTIHWNLTCV